MKIPIDPLTFVPFVSSLFSLWSRTLRYEVHGDFSVISDAVQSGESIVVSMWHGEIFPITAYQRYLPNKFVVIVSQSKDGEFIARVIERLGHATVRGSSSRGGVKALLQAKRVIEKGDHIGIVTVDGPRGPRHKPKDGVFLLAQRAKAKIVPIRARVEKKKVFDKSWDRFVMPFPFSKCHLYVGDPIEVTSEKLDKGVLSQEKKRLEERMHALLPDEE